MADLIHAAVVFATLLIAPEHLPGVLLASTVVYGYVKARAEAHEAENGWRRFVVGK